ncbi:proteasome subunit beta [Nanoarchaeota archaeon]
MKEETIKTGTTTIGLVCAEGVVLAADRRATSGNMIIDKNFTKIHSITDNIALTIAGTVSDVQLLVKLIRAELKLKDIRTDREATVSEASNLLAGMVYANIRKFSVIPGISHFIVGGKDQSGFHLFDVYPDGSLKESTEYISSGSGSVMAYGVLETMYKKNMPINDAVKLAVTSLNAAIQRDSASGSGFDVITITKDGVKKVAEKDLTVKVEL